jgi:hypothetical protein
MLEARILKRGSAQQAEVGFVGKKKWLEDEA